MSTNPPNILFLMSDQHRADLSGFAGNRVVKTPTLDRLAEQSAVFTNAYTPSPICIPARQCMAAGQWPQTCGVTQFGEDLPPFSMTFARHLSQFGYSTVCAGKLHHTGLDQMQGWTQRLAPDACVNPRYMPKRASDHRPEVYPESGVGKRTNQKEIETAGIGDGPYQRADALTIRATCDFIRDHWGDPFYDRPAGHLPTLLKVSLVQPHYPYLTDEQRFTYYLPRVSINNQVSRFDHPVLSRTQMGPDIDVTDRVARRATAAYYGMVDQMDAHYGQVTQSLEHVGHDLDDWWIIYTSDHGEMLGEHGVWEKTSLFEASVRVPLMIRPPQNLRQKWGFGGGGKRIDANVNLCDLFATLCDVAEVPRPEDVRTVRNAGLDSRSLLPLISGQASPGNGWDNQTLSLVHGTDLMIKQDALKYLFYNRPSAPEVLFDIEADPYEQINCIEDERYSEAVGELRRRRQTLGFDNYDDIKDIPLKSCIGR